MRRFDRALSLTIIKNINSLANYTFRVLPPDVLALMQRCYALEERDSTGNLLKLFEAYCDVAGHSISYIAMSSSSFVDVARGFLGALADESLVNVTSPVRQRYAASFNRLLNEMRKEVPLLHALPDEQRLPKNNRELWEEEKKSLSEDRVRYWNGWQVQGRKGKISFLPISLIWNSHGKEFAEEIYKRYCQNAEKKLAPSHSEFNIFLRFLSENSERWPAQSFQHPIIIKKLFVEHMIFSFKNTIDASTNILTKTRSYSKFIHTIEEIFLQSGVWTRPFINGLPCPVSKCLPGTHTNIKELPDGTLVKEKLITAVPLHLSDTEAIEILFKKIKSDNQLVVKWAKQKLRNIRKAQLRRERLAKIGTPIIGGNAKKLNISELGDSNVCATFHSLGLSHIRDNKRKIIGTTQISDISDLLAIPNMEHFFALQLLLVSSHPCLTEGFFTHFELYDKRGNLFGLTKRNNTYELTGYKDRKGGKLSEQVIQLSPREAVWVRQIISLTQPLRDELRAAGNDAWRYLFLHCAGAIGLPKRPEPFKINNKTLKHQKNLIQEFTVVSGESYKNMEAFLPRLSVTAFRASCGVEVYLDTHSVEEMARALGHTTYNSSLLSSYLPAPILEFFQTRWIRVFQRGLVCEAMRGSPYLLQATRFESMDELHTFLENHAIREIPEHLKNPDALSSNAQQDLTAKQYGENGQVLVSIDTGILTTLLSLNRAVMQATEQSRLCAKAIYWSQFTDLVVRHIEDEYNSDLHEYLNTARQHVDPTRMESLIYATST